MSAPAPAEWLSALEAELIILAKDALALPPVRVTTRGGPPPPTMEGAYLGFISSEGAYQIGLAATPEGCQAFARGLLSSTPSDPPLPQADVADAVCEIVNMLAGGVQRRIRKLSGLQVGLGLPTFFHGAVQPTERLGVSVAEIQVGELSAALLVLHPRTRSVQEH
ncbi:MAG TPA: chemotaxis protein CheX [Anaeromyxobacteraceae bacterium]